MDEDEASRISSLDLYEDLLLNDTKQPGRCLTIQEVNNEKQKLEEENRMLHEELTQATTSLTSLQKQHEVLRENFRSLLETAKRELERKDKVISDFTAADQTKVKSHYGDQLRHKKIVTKSSSLKGKRIDDRGNQTNCESELHAKEKATSHKSVMSGNIVLRQEIINQSTKIQSNTVKNIEERHLCSKKSSFTSLEPSSSRSAYKEEQSSNRRRLENRHDPRSHSRSSKRDASPGFHRSSRSRRSEEGKSYHRREKRNKSHSRSHSSSRMQSSVEKDLRDKLRLNRKSCNDNSSNPLVDKSLPLRRSADSSTDPSRNLQQLPPTHAKLDHRKTTSKRTETGIMHSKNSVRSHRNKEVNSSKKNSKSSDRNWESRDSYQSRSITDVTNKPTEKSNSGNATQNLDSKQQSSNFTPRYSATSQTITKKRNKPISNDPLKSVSNHDKLATLIAKTASILSDNGLPIEQTTIADENPPKKPSETKQKSLVDKIDLPTTAVSDVRLSSEKSKTSKSVDEKRSFDKSHASKLLPVTTDVSVSRKRKLSETRQHAEKLRKTSSSDVNKILPTSSNDKLPRTEYCGKFEHNNKLSTKPQCSLLSISTSSDRSNYKTSVATPIDGTEAEDKLSAKSLPLRSPSLKSSSSNSLTLPDQKSCQNSNTSSLIASTSFKSAVTSSTLSTTFFLEPIQKSAASTNLPQCATSVTTITNSVPPVTISAPRRTAVKTKLRKKRSRMRLSSTSSDSDQSSTPKDPIPHAIRSPLKKLSSKTTQKSRTQSSSSPTPASNQSKRQSSEDSDKLRRSTRIRDSSAKRHISVNAVHMTKLRKPQNKSSAFLPVLSSSSNSECNEEPVMMGLHCGQTCSLPVDELHHAGAQNSTHQVDDGLSHSETLLSPKKKMPLPMTPLKKTAASFEETVSVAPLPSMSSHIKVSSPTPTEVPLMTSQDEVLSPDEVISSTLLQKRVSSHDEALPATSSKSKTSLVTTLPATSLQDQTFAAASSLDEVSPSTSPRKKLSQDLALPLTLHENAIPTTSSCHHVQSHKDEPSQSFMYYYRIASLQYLLHLAKQLLAKHKSANKDSSRLLWIKSLNECQVRRRLNSRWLSEREPQSAPDLPVDSATTSSHFPDMHVTSSMTSSSWMHHEESMQNFFEGLMKVITPLKSLKKNDNEHPIVHASDSVRRKVLQSPNK